MPKHRFGPCKKTDTSGPPIARGQRYGPCKIPEKRSGSSRTWPVISSTADVGCGTSRLAPVNTGLQVLDFILNYFINELSVFASVSIISAIGLVLTTHLWARCVLSETEEWNF